MFPLAYARSRPAAARKDRAMTMPNLAGLKPGSPSFRPLVNNRPKHAKAIVPAERSAVCADIPELRTCTAGPVTMVLRRRAASSRLATSGATEQGILTVGKECI
jgi:hypothetical protein